MNRRAGPGVQLAERVWRSIDVLRLAIRSQTGTADAHCASLVVRPIRTRDLPEWEPEVGRRWLARMQQTGEYLMPPSV